MDHIPRLSEVLYVGLCRKIGTPTEVAIRRDVLDMEEMIMKPVYNQIGYVMVESGSYREGFRMSSSDRDRMLWFCNYKLITDVSQSRLYNSSKHTIVLIENSDTPPGFVKLRLLIPVPLSYIVFFNSGAYLSSRLWREKHFQFLLKSSSKSYPLNLTIQMHGPCSNSILGPFELDIGWCLASFPWPKLSRSCIERCQRHTWPSTSVLEKILKNECHCMPIRSKVESPYNELEWRLSFSKAEQQLVCSMNHTQFLCYGLLKLFLKEVINYN
ncbi:uncharacterized protein LOC134244082 [Saccostrea cucullata]|uniref:uncharacterized protein LOC134244082 n=1 Tax=Saccostrea cuccullata TaxID=36930 RepID=UPI002ED4B9D5